MLNCIISHTCWGYAFLTVLKSHYKRWGGTPMFPKNTAPLYGGCVLYTSPPAVQAAATCLILYIQYMQCEPLRRYSPIIQYSYLVWGRAGGRRASLLLPLPPLPCCTCYCTSVQFTNFVRELLVNITNGKVWMEYTIGQLAGEEWTHRVHRVLALSAFWYFAQ
jgi:hypothetical protein